MPSPKGQGPRKTPTCTWTQWSQRSPQNFLALCESKSAGKPALPGPVSYLYTSCLYTTLGPRRSRPKSAENLSARLEAEELYPNPRPAPRGTDPKHGAFQGVRRRSGSLYPPSRRPQNLPELKEMAGNGKPTKGLPAGGEKPLLRPKPPPERREGGQGTKGKKRDARWGGTRPQRTDPRPKATHP